MNRTVELAKKVINLKNSNNFINTSPIYTVTKPADWKFSYEDETMLFIDKESDDEGGGAIFTTTKFPYIVDTNIIEGSIKEKAVIAPAALNNSIKIIEECEEIGLNLKENYLWKNKLKCKR